MGCKKIFARKTTAYSGLFPRVCSGTELSQLAHSRTVSRDLRNETALTLSYVPSSKPDDTAGSGSAQLSCLWNCFFLGFDHHPCCYHARYNTGIPPLSLFPLLALPSTHDHCPYLCYHGLWLSPQNEKCVDFIRRPYHVLSDHDSSKYFSGCELFLDLRETAGALYPGLFRALALVYSYDCFSSLSTFLFILFHNHILDQKIGHI